jgi:GGDEF domain-containing protein
LTHKSSGRRRAHLRLVVEVPEPAVLGMSFPPGSRGQTAATYPLSPVATAARQLAETGRLLVGTDFAFLESVEELVKARGFQVSASIWDDVGFKVLAKRPGRDPRTGLFDWAGLDAAIDEFAALGLVGVITLDVRRMTRINAWLGREQGGDALLELLGGALAGLLEPGEVAGMYRDPGDEFQILIPGADLTAVKQRAVALEVALAALELPRCFAGLYQGVTAGWASRFPPDENPHHTSGRSLTMLYNRKQQRRYGGN